MSLVLQDFGGCSVDCRCHVRTKSLFTATVLLRGKFNMKRNTGWKSWLHSLLLQGQKKPAKSHYNSSSNAKEVILIRRDDFSSWAPHERCEANSEFSWALNKIWEKRHDIIRSEHSMKARAYDFSAIPLVKRWLPVFAPLLSGSSRPQKDRLLSSGVERFERPCRSIKEWSTVLCTHSRWRQSSWTTFPRSIIKLEDSFNTIWEMRLFFVSRGIRNLEGIGIIAFRKNHNENHLIPLILESIFRETAKWILHCDHNHQW